MMRQYELVDTVKTYDPSADEDALNRAYVLAMSAHSEQRRANGDPYFSHPVEVAGILADYHLDTGSIITALLHDTVEDTAVTLEIIHAQFGDEIAKLVDGVTKLTRVSFRSAEEKQAENFRKFLMAMSEDIRVLLVKLADRLHNMRTLHFIDNPQKRRRIALETMDIYVPLAERIGMHEVKNELEDMAFKELFPDAWTSISKRLLDLNTRDASVVDEIVDTLSALMDEEGVRASIMGRQKNPCSIWRKMNKKDIGFEQIADIYAFRILITSREECYRVLAILHDAFRAIPGRFKDYISTPKVNGYQSLHTGVIIHPSRRIEIQIRTRLMHEVAEFGVAAHWQYKSGYGHKEGKQYRWLQQLLDILENTNAPEDFLEHSRMEMYGDQVFCFTPKGDLINLPQGATAIDFAYSVHSEVGNTCVGTRINGRTMPLRTVLNNGDQVEILTAPTQTPSPTWEHIAITGKARARIRRRISLKKREEMATLGLTILKNIFARHHYELTDKGLESIAKRFKLKTAEDICVAVGETRLSSSDVLHAIYPDTKAIESETHAEQPVVSSGRKHKSIAINGLIPGMATYMAGCCHPLIGDRIVGIRTLNKGIIVHTIDCDALGDIQTEDDNWLDISWNYDEQSKSGAISNVGRVGRVLLNVLNVPGSLSEISTIIARQQANIFNMKFVARSSDFFDILIDIEVDNVRHLNHIVGSLRACGSVNSVERSREEVISLQEDDILYKDDVYANT